MLLLVSNLSGAQSYNLDFENWYMDSSGHERLSGFEHFSGYPYEGENYSFFGTWKETDIQNGDFALKLSRWYNYTNDWVRQINKINFNPANLSGYYKYTDNILSGPAFFDTASVSVFMTRWNTAESKRDTIGIGRADLTVTDEYVYFEAPINYADALSADSFELQIYPSKVGGGGICVNSGWCSYLTVDQLGFNAVVGTKDLNRIGDLKLYPNPARDYVVFGLAEAPSKWSVTDIYGRPVLSSSDAQGTTRIDISNLSPGVYYLIAGNKRGKFIKQ